MSKDRAIRVLKNKDIYEEISQRSGVNSKKVQFIWEQFVDIAIRELTYYGEFRLPFMAKIKLITTGARWTHVPDSEDRSKTKTIYVEQKQKLSFAPVRTFKEAVNGERLSATKRKVQKSKIKEEELIKKEFVDQETRARRADELFLLALENKKRNTLKRRNKGKSQEAKRKRNDVIDY